MHNQKEIAREFIIRNYEKLQDIKRSLKIDKDFARVKSDPVFLNDIEKEYKDKLSLALLQYICENSYIDASVIKEVLEEIEIC